MISSLCTPIVNERRVRIDDIKYQTNNHNYILRKKYTQQRGNQDRRTRDHTPECTCKVCRYNTPELHKTLRELHTGDPKEYFLCGPSFLKVKEICEKINQYNLKNKDKKIKVSEDRLRIASSTYNFESKWTEIPDK